MFLGGTVMETKWINESMFYHIYPLGFFGCDMEIKVEIMNPTKS